MATLTRSIVGTLAMIGLLLGMACAPAAPTPTAAPTKPAPTAAPAKPAATAAPATKSAGSPGASPAASPAAKPAANTDWKAEWDKTVAAAKQEGKVVVVVGPGEAYRDFMDAFKKAYPEITIEATGMSGPVAGPRLITERQAGQYLWDVYVGSAQTGETVLKPNGVLDPLRPILILPEILDNSKWIGGFETGWLDNDAKYVYCFQGLLDYFSYANRDLVPESELGAISQLVDPKWKGKIASRDPRIQGKALVDASDLMLRMGEDWLRKLFAQDIAVFQDDRQELEALVRGTYPIGLGLERSVFEALYKEGLAKNVLPIEGNSLAGQKWAPGLGNLMLVNKAPHPNAAKVFANWVLTTEGQKAYVEATIQNSRRLDVAGPPATALNPNFQYVTTQKEENVSKTDRVLQMAKEIIK